MLSRGDPQQDRYPAQRWLATTQLWHPSERRWWQGPDQSSHQQAHRWPARYDKNWHFLSRAIVQKCLDFQTRDQELNHKTSNILLSYSIKQSPRESNQLSAGHEIPRILWNPKFHYWVYKSLPPIAILSQINLVHATHPTSWISILILSSHSFFSIWSPKYIWRGIHDVVFSPTITLSLLGPNILLSSLFSNTLSPYSSLNVSNQVSHPYQTTGKIIVLCISIFIF